MHRPMRLLTIVVALLALAAGACGGSSSSAKGTDTTRSGGDGTTSTTAPVAGGADAPARPSPGCDATPSPAAVHEEKRTLDVDGTERWYFLTVPDKGLGKPQPVVFDFHGLAEGAQVHVQMSGMSATAEQDGFVAVVPQGTGAIATWATAPDPATNLDLQFVSQLLDTLGNDLCIDTARVYATGLSNGAMFSTTLACTMADRFTAVAPVSGILELQGCNPSRPIPIVTFHGTADPILSFNGGPADGLTKALSGQPVEVDPNMAYDVDGPGYPANVRWWASELGCDPTPTDRQVTPEVTDRVYDCPPGTALEFYVIVGGGHTWPGSGFSQNLSGMMGPTNMDLHANDVIWDFFSRFSLP